MNLYLANNIFSKIFLSALPADKNITPVFKDSALICSELEKDRSAVALIPTLELINHRALFVSSKIGISFDGPLSNSYLYFPDPEKSFTKLKVRGDISINEIILSKILFSERYSTNIEITLDAGIELNNEDVYLIMGNENFMSRDFSTGLSFSDMVAEMLDLPYVNFVFTSMDKESLAKFNGNFENIDINIEDNISSISDQLEVSDEVKNYVKVNIGSLYFEMTDNEKVAVKELVKLIYYHGIIDDIFDIKFI